MPQLFTFFASTQGKMIAFWAIVLIIIAWKWKQITSFFYSKRGTDDNNLVEGGGEVPPKWVENELPALVTDFNRLLNASFPNACIVLKKAMDLNDNQLRALANSYENYYREKLLDRLDTVWNFETCYSYFMVTSREALIARMRALNIA